MSSLNDLETKIGIIGGGQLGKMMIQEAKKMGMFVTILDPADNCPAHSIADAHVVADFDDEAGLRKLAGQSDVLTYEFEHIGVDILQALEEEGHPVYPTPKSLAVIQNKLLQKTVLKREGLPVPAFLEVKGPEQLREMGDRLGFPFLLKACTGGYDGKGNALIQGPEDFDDAYRQLGSGDRPLMAEAFVPFEKEISVLACRGITGDIVVYPVAENVHQESILIETRVPAELSPAVADRAIQMAHHVMEVFKGVGMFCVEMFVTHEGEVAINEVAPRPHNSGHYSIEGCVTSQFEQHVRAILGLPLGDTTLLRPTVMRNLLGEEGCTGKAYVTGVHEALGISGVKLHIYGKQDTKPKRKMGHITVTAQSVDVAALNAKRATGQVKILSNEEEIS